VANNGETGVIDDITKEDWTYLDEAISLTKDRDRCKTTVRNFGPNVAEVQMDGIKEEDEEEEKGRDVQWNIMKLSKR